MLILNSQTFNDESLLGFAQSLSSQNGTLQEQILHWDFGPIMEMKYDLKAKNYLFSDESVPFHWDGAFYKEPRKLLFFCTDTEGEGGETIFVNTEAIWESLTPFERSECQKVRLIYQTDKLAHYGGVIDVPLVQKHPETGNTILRMAEKVETKLNPVKLRIIGTRDEEGFYKFMLSKLYNQKFQYIHRWQKGDLLVADNFTYLHGRLRLGNNKKRTFKRVQIL